MQIGQKPLLECDRLLDRRGFVAALLAGGSLLAAGRARAMGAEGPSVQRLAFDIRRDGASIGGHRVAFRRDGDRLEVDIEIDIAVNLAFIPLFAYSHRNHEVWQDGRLVALDSRTDDDGSHYAVSARASGGGLRVIGNAGDLLVPPETLPTSYWNVRTVEQTQLLDTQQGGLLDVRPLLVGEERLDGGVAARRYRLAGDLNLDLWYSDAGEWLKIAFQARGADVSYDRRPPVAGGSGIAG